LYIHVRVRLDWQSENQTLVSEESETIVVNAHGALLRLASVPPLGQKVTLQNIPANEIQEAVVVFVGRPTTKDGKTGVGVEFTKANASFWRVTFPPADWSRSHPDAKDEVTRRTPRYQFSVDVIVTDIQGKVRITARTNTLGIFGCGINTLEPFAQGTSVKVRMTHRGAKVKAIGLVVYTMMNVGMGISFIDIDKEDERILESWTQESMCTENVLNEN
jgi:hypothetical protein